MKMENLRIVSSQRITLPHGEPGWCVNTELKLEGEDTPRLIPHFFPDSCFVVRSVEWGVDPADTDTLLDIILFENYIPREEFTDGTSVYGDAGMDESRRAHINRCAKVKLGLRTSTRANKSTLKAKAARPDDPTTAADVSAKHPLDAIRGHLRDNKLCPDQLAECRALLKQAGHPNLGD